MRIASLALTSLLVACTSASTTPPEPLAAPPVVVQPPASPTPPAPTGAQVRLLITEQPMDQMETPRSAIRVAVTHAGVERSVDVGTLAGCNLAETPTPGSLATLRCGWAGAGDTVEVLTREDAVIVTRQEADSEAEEEFPVRELGRVALGGASVELVH